MYWLFGIAGLALLIFVCWFIDDLRKKKRKNIHYENVSNYFDEFSDEILKNAELYKQKNKKWNVCPDLNSLLNVYAVVLIRYEDEDRYVWKFVKFHDISNQGGTLKINYYHNIPGGYFHGQKKELQSITFTEDDFNKKWFISEELAKEVALSKFREGSKTINPDFIDL